jgi:enoyl-CoA hydratase/carnithine racemase
MALITEDTDGHVRLIGLNRPEKRNAFNLEMLDALCAAFARAEADEAVRVMVVHAHGPVFTAGLDLLDVFPRLGEGKGMFSPGAIDPWATHGAERTKPLVLAIHGKCLTLGIELALAGDVTYAADDAVFAQIEIARGIFPFGGGTARWVQAAGWGNAMQYLLTGDEFGAAEAHRIGVVQRVLPRAELLPEAVAFAKRVSAQAPLGVLATLRSARVALREGERAAAAQLLPEIMRLAGTADVQEGVAAFVERRPPRFTGR